MYNYSVNRCRWIQPEYFTEFCEQKPETGNCRGSMERWYYDKETGLCKSFEYGGCDGNKNNFETQDQCEKTCQFEKPPRQGKKMYTFWNIYMYFMVFS